MKTKQEMADNLHDAAAAFNELVKEAHAGGLQVECGWHHQAGMSHSLLVVQVSEPPTPPKAYGRSKKG